MAKLPTVITTPLKGAGKGALIGAGIVAVGSMLAFGGKGKKFNPDEQPVVPLPPLMTPQDLMMQQQMSMMQPQAAGPAEGYAPNQWQNYVRPGAAQQQEIGAGQPRMSAVSPETVQNLGGVTPQKA